MSTYFDLPEHLRIGVDEHGRGPITDDNPRFDHYECWCGEPGCTQWQVTEPQGDDTPPLPHRWRDRLLPRFHRRGADRDE